MPTCECCREELEMLLKKKGRMVCNKCFTCYNCTNIIASRKYNVLLDRFYCEDCEHVYHAQRAKLGYFAVRPSTSPPPRPEPLLLHTSDPNCGWRWWRECAARTGHGAMTNFSADRPLKLVIVGDAFVGKTSLIFAYTQQLFVEDYEPTVFQNYTASVVLNRRKVSLNIFDTTGQTQERLAKLRLLSYPHADVVLLCFSLIDPLSLDSCRRRWLPEIRAYTQAPILMVGTKEDLLEKAPLDQRVDRKQALRMVEELGCHKLLPCSALTLRGLKRVFDEALLLASTGQTSDQKPSATRYGPCCCIL